MSRSIPLFPILMLLFCSLTLGGCKAKPLFSAHPASDMIQSRMKHMAARLPDGRVLLMGGYLAHNPRDVPLLTAELFNPKQGRFDPAGSMHAWHGYGTATALRDARVLVAGGGDAGQRSCKMPASLPELYSSKTGRFSPTGSMRFPRLYHQAVLLTDGKVLITGGIASFCCPLRDPRQCPESGLPLQQQEVFDPATGRFSPAPRLNVIQSVFSAAPLPEDRALVLGSDGKENHASGVAEIVDLKRQTVKVIPCPPLSLFSLQTAPLPDGKVLIFSHRLFVFDPKRERFTPVNVPEPVAKSYVTSHSLATLPGSGNVFIFGSFVKKPLLGGKPNSVSLFDANRQTFQYFGAFPDPALRDFTITALSDREILIAGGCDFKTCLRQHDTWMIHLPDPHRH